MSLATVDYETDGIKKRPEYPPVPVGVAISYRGKNKYYAWGHPIENNCTKDEAIRAVKLVQKESDGIIYHNAPFDMEVQEKHLKIKMPDIFHDTQFLAYLFDPRQDALGLKPLADKWLNMPPDEQTTLRQWIEANVEIETGNNWGAYISLAPGKLVGKYAIGDVVRTEKLFKKFYPVVKDLGMLAAYEREIKVARIKLKMEKGGVRVNAPRMKRELPKFEKLDKEISREIRKKLKITPTFELDCPKGFFNLSSSKQLADALVRAGKVDVFIQTEKGNDSTSVANLRKVCKDKKLIDLIAVQSVLGTYKNTFIKPWIATAETGGGYIFPTFNQVKTYDDERGGKTYGTITGRPSSSNPNLNNVPAGVEGSKNEEILLFLQKLLHERGVTFLGLRDYIQPDEGGVLLDRDYNQQELRVLAHYESGELLDRYLENPSLNIHVDNRARIKKLTGADFKHKKVKITSFRTIYGTGAKGLAEELDISLAEARELKAAIYKAMPGLATLENDLKKHMRAGEKIRTWGGRVYGCEPPKLINGKYRSFEYKTLNLLIQGSSADITKEAMIRVDEACSNSRMIAQVYDEILLGTDRGAGYKKEMRNFKEAMESIKLDLALPTDGGFSTVSWGRLKDYKD